MPAQVTTNTASGIKDILELSCQSRLPTDFFTTQLLLSLLLPSFLLSNQSVSALTSSPSFSFLFLCIFFNALNLVSYSSPLGFSSLNSLSFFHLISPSTPRFSTLSIHLVLPCLLFFFSQFYTSFFPSLIAFHPPSLSSHCSQSFSPRSKSTNHFPYFLCPGWGVQGELFGTATHLFLPKHPPTLFLSCSSSLLLTLSFLPLSLSVP